MEKRIEYALCLAVFSVLALSLFIERQSAQASEIEKWLIMPAPVTASHAEFEAECDSCHAPLSNQLQGQLCVVCHTEVGDDVERQSGFHGQLPQSQRLDCASCHTDHEGRDMNIINFDESSFDHSMTDFTLHGAHVGVSCIACHSDDALKREAPTVCVDCHQSDDVHQGRFGDDCGECHSDSDWNQAKFDHNRTRFSLSGAHKNVACDSCHMSTDFANVGRTCLACHQADDVHKGKNGGQCADCHSTATWENPTFDHHALTGFGLVGGHKGVACKSCHRNEDFSDPGNGNCQSCHLGDDVHKGSFGANCGGCHNVFDWGSMNFDHKRETGFALPPGHGDLECSTCHTGDLTEALPTSCGTCHAGDDPHLGQLGERCETCHVATSWIAQLWFDHDITSFPLVGVHSDVACLECHTTPAFHDADAVCASCHTDDDPHQGALGEQCDSCHNPTSWRAWQFDHDIQTGFSLTGSHVNLECAACHTENMDDTGDIRDDCNSCHRRDDPHFGRFGNNCEACHTTTSFKQIEGM